MTVDVRVSYLLHMLYKELTITYHTSWSPYKNTECSIFLVQQGQCNDRERERERERG